MNCSFTNDIFAQSLLAEPRKGADSDSNLTAKQWTGVRRGSSEMPIPDSSASSFTRARGNSGGAKLSKSTSWHSGRSPGGVAMLKKVASVSVLHLNA